MKGLKVLAALMLVTTVFAGAMSPVAAAGSNHGSDGGTDCSTETSAEVDAEEGAIGVGVGAVDPAVAVAGDDAQANSGDCSNVEQDGDEEEGDTFIGVL